MDSFTNLVSGRQLDDLKSEHLVSAGTQRLTGRDLGQLRWQSAVFVVPNHCLQVERRKLEYSHLAALRVLSAEEDTIFHPHLLACTLCAMYFKGKGLATDRYTRR